MSEDAAAIVIMDLVIQRGATASICPTEAARELAVRHGVAAQPEAWRQFLPAVRRAAVALAGTASIDILRKGKVIAPDAVHGVIRLRLHRTMEENQ